MLEWTVRGIYADQAGWFDGNATKLFLLPEKDRATRPSPSLAISIVRSSGGRAWRWPTRTSRGR